MVSLSQQHWDWREGQGLGALIVNGKGLNGVSCFKKNVEGALRLLNRS